jgi:hypothetical protein
MVFPRNALASGPGMACNSIAFTTTWRKVKVVKFLRFFPEKKSPLIHPGAPRLLDRLRTAIENEISGKEPL